MGKLIMENAVRYTSCMKFVNLVLSLNYRTLDALVLDLKISIGDTLEYKGFNKCIKQIYGHKKSFNEM